MCSAEVCSNHSQHGCVQRRGARNATAVNTLTPPPSSYPGMDIHAPSPPCVPAPPHPCVSVRTPVCTQETAHVAAQASAVDVTDTGSVIEEVLAEHPPPPCTRLDASFSGGLLDGSRMVRGRRGARGTAAWGREGGAREEGRGAWARGVPGSQGVVRGTKVWHGWVQGWGQGRVWQVGVALGGTGAQGRRQVGPLRKSVVCKMVRADGGRFACCPADGGGGCFMGEQQLFCRRGIKSWYVHWGTARRVGCVPGDKLGERSCRCRGLWALRGQPLRSRRHSHTQTCNSHIRMPPCMHTRCWK